MKHHIYLLCGLGADERLFDNLDLSEFEVTPIKWITPGKRESMEDYARKLVPQISSPNPILMGVSFGGMVAIELAKIIHTHKIILISSAAKRDELRSLYLLAGRLKIHRLIHGRILKNSHRLMNWVMGANDPVRRNLLADMLRKTDEKFLHWAIDKVVTWKNTVVPVNVFRIHGTKDPVLPLHKADYIVDAGGHLIVANRAKEVTTFIKLILLDNSSSGASRALNREPH